MNLQKYSRARSNRLIIFLIILILFPSCQREEQKTGYVARVEDSYLTKEDFYRLYNPETDPASDSIEIINNWVRYELAWHEAMSEGLINSPEHKLKLEQLKKKYAYHLLVEKFLNDEVSEISENEFNAFFEANKSFYQLKEDASVLNIAKFKNEEIAIKWRSELIQSGWKSASAAMRNLKSVSISENQFLYDHQLPGREYHTLINQMNPGEISLVVKEDESVFTVFELTTRLPQGSVPDKNLIRQTVINDIITEKRHKVEKEIIEKLSSEYTIEIK